MSKINVLLPKINRLGGSDPFSFVFQTKFVTADNVSGGGQITVKLSDTEDFAFPTIVTPTSFDYNDDNGHVWTTVSGNSIASQYLKKYLRVTIDSIGAERAQFAKLIYTEGAKVFESTAFILTTFTKINFLQTTPIDTGGERVKKIKVTDKISATAPFTIKVEACNNPYDSVPVWEDITESYQAGKFHLFANRIKESDKNWGIRIRYTITKNSVTDAIEISEFSIGYIK